MRHQVERLAVGSRLAVNTAETAADAASAGAGITRLLCYQVSEAVLDGGSSCCSIARETDCETAKMLFRRQPWRFAGRSVATTFLAESDPTVEQ